MGIRARAVRRDSGERTAARASVGGNARVRIHLPPAKSRANSTCRSKKRQSAAPENARHDGGFRVTVANTPPSSLQLALHGRGYRPPHYLVPRWRWRWCRYCAGDRAKRAAGCCPESSWRREVTGQVDAHQPDCGHSFPTIGWPRCAWVAGVSSLHGYDAPRDLALGNSKALQVGDSSYRKVEVYF